MKKLLLLGTTIVLLHAVYAQEPYRELIATDPELSNGYFILDSLKAAGLGVVRLEVDIDATRAETDSTFTTRNLQHINVTNGLYGGLDPSVLVGTDENDRIHYTLTGYDLNDNVTWGPVASLQDGNSWPEACELTCHSMNWAWRLNGYGNGALAAMDISNGAQDGSYFYFYMEQDYFNQTWSLNPGNTPADYGFTWTTSWTEVFDAPSDEVITLTLTGNEIGQNGYPLGSPSAGHAGIGIRKDRGPWRDLYSWTNEYDQGIMCLNMKDIFDTDPIVVGIRNNLNPNPGPLQCWALPGGGGGIGWGSSGPFNPCTQSSVWEFGGNVYAWADAAIDCFTTYTPAGGSPLSAVHRIDINRWEPGSSTPVVGVDIPAGRDPKLIPFPRTMLQPGLYEFRLLMNNGAIIRHFEAIDAPAVVSADFASFVDVNIYPVPVTDRYFSIDMDLLAPMDIGLTIINNQGTVYYTESLEFDVAGRNKHVVTMATLWPEGIYHAVFQFADGSNSSVSFTVAR